MEGKYGKSTDSIGSRVGAHSKQEDKENSDSSTDSEEEDDEGILVSEPLDAQIQSTLEAIRKKDPRVYDKDVKFYTEADLEEQNARTPGVPKEKPMYLSDYHRKNLLDQGAVDDLGDSEPKSYTQHQDNLKNIIVKEMHAAVDSEDGYANSHGIENEEANDGFLIRKLSPLQEEGSSRHVKKRHQELDVEAAEEDPEAYLSNFMSARAWVPSSNSRFQPFESDDEEEERRAELFEEAYNLRFEDPQTSNEKLMSHARDAAARYSVRKETMNTRKKAREAERTKKEIIKQAREEEKARFRRLKVSEAEEKVRRIREAAGMRAESLQQEDWLAFLEEGWDDARWEQAMRDRFGDDYYADEDGNGSNGADGERKRKIRKPKWEDDIDIGDLIPDFDSNEKEKPQFELTEDEHSDGPSSAVNGVEGRSENVSLEGEPTTKKKPAKKREKDVQRRVARQERRKIENLVDQQMKVDETLSRFGKKHAGQFRYRETSPTAYGLTAQDILLASDSQLNQYAGLKKMAAFRDSDKKRKDKKHLGKKARLRQWRKDTFGNEQGPQKTLAEILAGEEVTSGEVRRITKVADIREGKKKARSRKGKASKGVAKGS